MSENYELHDLTIKPKKLCKKGKYTLPCTILGIMEQPIIKLFFL